MKKLPVRSWLLIGAMGAFLFACQSKKNASTPQPQSTTPCTTDDCPPTPPQNIQCREGECDEQEAGEETKATVIEISEPAEKSETAKESTSTSEAVLETLSETPESAETTVQAPSILEEPTTQIFDELPNSPVAENTVVLSLEE